MQKLQDSVFRLVKTNNLSPAVFSFLQPTDDSGDKTPLGGIFKDTKHGWLALGPKFCVVDLRTGMKVAARTFGATLSKNTIVASVVELPTPLTENSLQLIISLQCDEISIIVVLNINGSQILRCIQTDVVVTELTVCDKAPDGIFECFDGIAIAGTKRGEIFAFDLNRTILNQALKDISQGYEHLIQNELNPTNLSFLPLDAVHRIEEQRELALENDHHLAVLLNENSFIDGQYIFRNPDGSVRMKANRDHIRVTVSEYIPQTGSVAVGFNFGAFQIWNLMTLNLEFTSQVNVECLPVTHFGFQEPCDDPRAFCYLWVIFSVVDRYEEEEFPLAVMYSLTYQGKRMLSDTKCLYQDFLSATVRFQVELSNMNEASLLGGKCISCHTYSIKSTLGDEGEDNMLNLCQLVWECWSENTNSPMQYGMLLFDLDQWYKDQMPSTYRVQSNAFLSASSWSEMSGGSGSVALHARLDPASVTPYSHATRLEEHFYPNSLQYNCICLNTSEVCVLSTAGIQRQIIGSMDEVGPTVLLHPPRLYAACVGCGLAPLYAAHANHSQEEQRRYLLSVALEARLARFLKRCAHDWATGSHSGVGCTLPFLVDWCWKRAIELKENAKELTAPLFISAALPDRNIVRCLEHCVQQLTQLTGLMDAILTKCCNLVVPDALSEMEEKHKGIGTVSLYFQVVQWFLRVGLLPERVDGSEALPYPAVQLYTIYNKRRLKLNRIQENGTVEENSAHKSCLLLYIDQLLEQEFGGDRIHQMWINGGSECRGLYPPPSLYALLRLYLLPDIAEEHKHSLVLYLLVDYSMMYDDVRYETVIRRLMQFPTMFGLSNTAIKATQAFWHLDHRDFDFALDQLQCLTGNTLSEWQHNVVLSSLLAQKKTQAALQYLHVRKPAPIQNIKDGDYKVNDYDKLDDWQSCCNLYLARGLVYEALDVIRMCVQNADSLSDKTQVLNMFFKGCRNTGNLSKILSVSFSSFEEEAFVKYLDSCNEPQTSNILIMYYLQQSRYLEAERYNSKLRHSKPKSKDLTTSVESLFDSTDREGARDNLVQAMCAALPSIAETVAHCAFDQRDVECRVHAPKPMSVYLQAKSSKNCFTYKSSFIQDTIQNASETWVNRPKIRKGLKRMLNIEETPFICTPKLSRSRSIFNDNQSESTPSKRARLNLTGTPKTPRSAFKVSDKLSSQMEKLLDMPEAQSPVGRTYDRPGTPHSILKLRRNSRSEDPSPVCSRYLDDTDDELEMETASNHTHYSDSTNKHLRFTIPTPTEMCTEPTPSPVPSRNVPSFELAQERERSVSTEREREIDVSTAESYFTTASHAMNESNPLESPPKKLATEANVAIKKAYKDSVQARRSLSISANSSLSDDPNTSIESIADIPITLINPRYSGTRRRSQSTESRVDTEKDSSEPTETQDKLRFTRERRSMSVESTKSSSETKYTEKSEIERDMDRLEVPKTPRGRRGIRASGESTPLRSGSVTPERQDSPAITPLRRSRISRSRSKTPELSPRSSPLPPIMEQPKQESASEPHAERSTLSLPRNLRSRSRTPERLEKGVSESPKLEVIKESPTKSGNDSPPLSPSRRNLRSRSRTPEVEVTLEPVIKPSPRSLRSRSKTPEKLMSPKKEHSIRTKKSLSRLVLEANTFAKTKHTLELLEAETASESKSEPETRDIAIECTPMKPSKQVANLMDFTLSPIATKSVLHSSSDSLLSESADKEPKEKGNTNVSLLPMPNFTPLQETYYEKSVLRSYQSSIGDSSESIIEEKEVTTASRVDLITMPAFTSIHEDFERSVLHSYESSLGESSSMQATPAKDAISFKESKSPINTDFSSILHSHQSSIAESSQRDTSSLITDDSDVQMTETENREKAEQKEKATIVEIEREIHEVEDMHEKNECEESSEEEEAEVIMKERSDNSDDSMAASDEDTIHISSDDSSDSEPSSSRSSAFVNPPLVTNEWLDGIMKADESKPGKKSYTKKATEDSESERSSTKTTTEDSDDSRESKEVKSDSSSSPARSVKTSYDKYEESDSESDSSGLKNCEDSYADVSDNSDEVEKKLDAVELPKQIPSKTKDKDILAKANVTTDKAQVPLLTEDNSLVIDNVTPAVNITNPQNQAQVSLMTDDNSTNDSIEITKLIDRETLAGQIPLKIESQEQVKSGSNQKSEKLIQTKTSEVKTEKLDDASKIDASDPLAQVSLMTEDDSMVVDNSDVTAPVDVTNPLDQAQVSLMTDDNSTVEPGSCESSVTIPNFVNPPLVSDELLEKIMIAAESKSRKQAKSNIEDSDDSSQSRENKSDSNSSPARTAKTLRTVHKPEASDSESNSSGLKNVEYEDSEADVSDDSSEVEEKLGAVKLPKQKARETKNKDEDNLAKICVTTDQAQISLMPEDNSMVIDNNDVTAPVQVTNPLDQAQVILMTDDNTTIDKEKLASEVLPQIEIQEKVQSDSKQKTETLDDASKKEASDSLAQVSLMTEDNSMVIDNNDVTTTVEVTNPLDQAQVSLRTEDNSTVDNIKITMPIDNVNKPQIPKTDKLEDASKKEASDRLAQVPMITGDSSGSEQELCLNYSDEKIESSNEQGTEMLHDIPMSDEKPIKTPTSPKSLDVVDTSASETETKEPDVLAEPVILQNTKTVTVIKKMDIVSQNKDAIKLKTSEPKTEQKILKSEAKEPNKKVTKLSKSEIDKQIAANSETVKQSTTEKMDTTELVKAVKISRTRKRVKSSSSNSEIEPKVIDEPKTPATRKRAQSRAKSTDLEIPKEVIEAVETSSTSETQLKVVDKPKTPTRNRAQSRTKSTDTEIPKKTDEPKTPVTRKRPTKTTKTDIELTKVDDQIIASSKTNDAFIEEMKTPITRKRSQSTTSNQSEETTPENVTPTRGKTPTNIDVRKIITRRMSREMKLDESNRSLDESVTPKRTRTRKNTDDSESVASGSSMASSVQSGEGKARRGRKSTVATKPELSVIPEVLAEEKEQSQIDVINEYSGTRRLTRNQQKVLNKSLGVDLSTASPVSKSSVSDEEEDDRSLAYDLQPIDRISLLNKESYDGPPDEDELQLGMSPESIASDASRMRSRMARAASETKVVKAAKIHRRIASLDIPEESELLSPGLGNADSPARNRRASFTRAVEALHTPKGRRLSTDSRKSDVGSPIDSPVASEGDVTITPSRRGRRASVQSNTSQTGRTRSKKMPVLEEIKETK